MARDCIEVKDNGDHVLAVDSVSRVTLKNEQQSSEMQRIRRELLSLADRATKLATRLNVLITKQGQE